MVTQRYVERGLEFRLVKARECPAGVDRLKLGYREPSGRINGYNFVYTVWSIWSLHSFLALRVRVAAPVVPDDIFFQFGFKRNVNFVAGFWKQLLTGLYDQEII